MPILKPDQPSISLPQELLSSGKLRLDAQSTAAASTDFGGHIVASPTAVLYPTSLLDIASLILFSFSSSSPFPISARGNGHSVHGQALAPNGVVIDMSALRSSSESRISVISCGPDKGFVDAGGEQLWIDVLHETLKHGLAPRSWTDYLYLTVGGTLSNAGKSGQAFLHGPQISNVHELDVITGKGELMTCSENQNSELFFAALGGLGQFGIITRARIPVEAAPEKVRWVRMIYTEFRDMIRDQEILITKGVGKDKEKAVGLHYVEGSLLLDHSLISSWRSSFFSAEDLEKIRGLAIQYGGIYCLEGAMYYDSVTPNCVDEGFELLLEELSFAPGFVFTNDVSYLSFLNRVRDGELKLRSMGLWDVRHPWLNLFVPKSRILDFHLGVFKGILKHNKLMGPILIYPTNKNKWDDRMSAMIPDEDIFYCVGLLQSATTVHSWEYLDDQNNKILQFCDQAGIKYKQYLPQYRTQADWMKHFGKKWDNFVEMKLKYDPKALLSRGQGIFTSPLVDHAF